MIETNQECVNLETQTDQNVDTNTLNTTKIKSIQLDLADAMTRYEMWPAPTVIVSDGPYGLGIFPGEPPTHEDLAEWYEPHIAAWAKYALPETTLWFWCNEIGWATVHPILIAHGWQYRALHVWDKGVAHIAGNVNSKTIRRFPVVTEVCVQYVRDVTVFTNNDQHLSIRDWLRYEWLRTGLPLYKTNEACGIKNAATRKYFTQDHLWYFPPSSMMERLAEYANKHGKQTKWPYFSLDGVLPVTAEQWERMRAKWHHVHSLTNVWSEPAVRGDERIKDNKAKIVHANQKPLRLIERIITASSDAEDVVWEPFGGLCSAAVASLKTDRRCFSAEINADYYELARTRLLQEGATSLWDV